MYFFNWSYNTIKHILYIIFDNCMSFANKVLRCFVNFGNVHNKFTIHYKLAIPSKTRTYIVEY